MGATFRPEDIDKLIGKLAEMQITFVAYVRPRPTLPVQVSLPPGLQSVKKPSLLNHPAPPAPVQKPTLAPSPPPPSLLAMPQLKPMPAVPVLDPKPPLTPHPTSRPLPKPPLKPHPLAPTEPPRPKLHPVPQPPIYYPRVATLGPPDPFLTWVSIGGIFAGFLVFLVAQPVGVVIMTAFSAWLVVLMVTENQRRELARKSLTTAHELECERIDEEYADLCQPIEEANKVLNDAWKEAKSVMAAKHQRLCKGIDDENHRRLAAWEEGDEVRRAEHGRACVKIDVANRQLIAPWEAKNAVIMAWHDKATGEIERANRVVLAAWETENSSRQGAYDKARRDIDQENQRLTSAWDALTASRKAEHDRACREIDSKNRQLIADWQAANAPWVAEEKRWRDRVVSADAEVRRLEAEVNAQRTASQARFQRRKGDANGIVASHSRAKLDYENELRQAEANSMQIQLDEHLDKSLIRRAKLKGITSDRVLSLESFGIETAKDVLILNNQKVPGIGPVLSKRLFDWRNSLASSFRPKQTLPESEKNRIASRYAPVLLPLGQSIQGAIHELDVIAGTHRTRESELVKAIGTALQNVAIAEAHVRAMKVG